MTRRQLVRQMHELWERAQTIHLKGSELLKSAAPDDPYRQLILELALQDLVSFASRAAALSALAEVAPQKRKKR